MSRLALRVFVPSLLVLVCLSWSLDLWFWSDPVAAHHRDRDPTKVATSGQTTPDANTHRARRGLLGDSAEADTLSLTLEVRDPEGGEVQGILTWRPVQGSMEPGSALPMIRGSRDGDIRQQAFAGSAQLSVPRGQGVWLRICRQGMPRQGFHRRLAAVDAARTETIRIDPGERCLHIQVWNPQVLGPARSRTVRVFHRDIHAGSAPSLFREVQTDAHGYVCVSSLDAGAYLVVAPGAQLGDRAPHAAQAILPDRLPICEGLLSLVARPATQEVRLRLQADEVSKEPQSMSPKLFFRRLDDLSGSLFPVGGIVRSGKSVLSTRLPVGNYELDVLPLGSRELRSESLMVKVSAGQDASMDVRVTRPQASTQLELVGVDAKHLPMTVHARPAGQEFVVDPSLLFLGPYRWRRSSAAVGRMPGPHVLIGRGGGACYISAAPVQLSGGKVQARMVPAASIRIRWTGEAARAQSVAVLTLRDDDGEQIVRMERSLLTGRAGSWPGHQAQVFVRVGAVSVACHDGNGELVWRRDVKADGPSVTLHVN